MKIVTIVNETYTDMAHNFYLQLKNFDIHKNFIVYCDNKKTLKKFKKLNLDCESRCFVATLPNNYLHLLECDNNIQSWDHPKWSMLQVIKHDIVHSLLCEYPNENVLLTDTDIIIFDNPIPGIEYLLSNVKNPYNLPLNFLVKHYYHWKRDYSKINQQQYGGHCRSIVNTGFMVFKNSEETRSHVRKYYENIVSLDYNNKCNAEGCSNVDENIITDYIENNRVQCKEMPNWLNTLSDMGHVYDVEEVLGFNIKPKTYHITFTPNKKVDFLKNCGAWLL